MKYLKTNVLTVLIATISLFFSLALVPDISKGQSKFTISSASIDAGSPFTIKSWEDRSDETFDKLNSGSQATTWIIVGSLAWATTAIIMHNSNKKKEVQQEQQADEEESTSSQKVSVKPFMGLQQNPMQIRTDHKSFSDNVIVGVSVSF